MKIRLFLIAALSFTLVSSCMTGPKDDDLILGSGSQKNITRPYKASSTFFQTSPRPRVWEKQFKSSVTVNSRANMKSYRFSNYVDSVDKPSVTVALAISDGTAGLGIYDENGKPLSEYPKGRVMSDSIFHEIINKQGRSNIPWFIGPEAIVSVIESFDKRGKLGYYEVTMYTPQ